MLYTKCIFLPVERSDGTRISVMSRHTLEDGVTPDHRIAPTLYKEWRKEFAPPDTLVGDYYKRGLPWPEFEKRYLAHLRTPEVGIKVISLAKRAAVEDITLLCAEETPEHCHRRLLAEECQRYETRLKVQHR
ncbi:MAG: DUF488 domain-containing protein [Candidatus Woesearchaeota archaeon]